MQTISQGDNLHNLGDNLHKMSKPILWEIEENILKYCLLKFLPRVLSIRYLISQRNQSPSIIQTFALH